MTSPLPKSESATLKNFFMKIIDRLKYFNLKSDSIRDYINHILATLDQLDDIDQAKPSTITDITIIEHKSDDLMVDMFEFIQWIASHWNDTDPDYDYISLGNELEDELLNDFSVSRETRQEKLQRCLDVVSDSLWVNVWEQEELIAFTESLKGTLQERLAHHLIKANTLPDFWERMSVSTDYPYIINGKTLNVDRAEQLAKDWGWRLELYFRQGYLCQKEVMNRIEDADKQLNPQPDTKQDVTTEQIKLLKNDEIIELFSLLIEQGYMEQAENKYRWLKSNVLLSYLCERLSNIFDLSEKRGEDDKEFINWSVFGGLFIVKGQKGEFIANGKKLNRYRTDWLKNHKPNGFSPKGYEDIEELLYDYK